jgi:hypothetical protein
MDGRKSGSKKSPRKSKKDGKSNGYSNENGFHVEQNPMHAQSIFFIFLITFIIHQFAKSANYEIKLFRRKNAHVIKQSIILNIKFMFCNHQFFFNICMN